MAAASWLRYVHLAHFSKPKVDRLVYRLIKNHRICRIVELGIASLRRTEHLVEVAQRFSPEKKIHFTGLDWFDARPNELPVLGLKQTHQFLQPSGAAVRLVPGSPAGSVPAVANSHQNTDLLLISHLVDEQELDISWFYVPRMLHEKSIVLREQSNSDGQMSLVRLSLDELTDRANRSNKRRAA